MKDRPPPSLHGRIAPEAFAFDVWLRRGVTERFGAALEPPSDDLVRLASSLYR